MVSPGALCGRLRRVISRQTAAAHRRGEPSPRPHLTTLRLSRDHSVRFPDGASFVASVFQALVSDFRPKLFQSVGCRFVRVPFGFVRGPRHCRSPADGFRERTRGTSDSSILSRRPVRGFKHSTRLGGAHARAGTPWARIRKGRAQNCPRRNSPSSGELRGGGQDHA